MLFRCINSLAKEHLNFYKFSSSTCILYFHNKQHSICKIHYWQYVLPSILSLTSVIYIFGSNEQGLLFDKCFMFCFKSWLQSGFGESKILAAGMQVAKHVITTWHTSGSYILNPFRIQYWWSFCFSAASFQQCSLCKYLYGLYSFGMWSTGCWLNVEIALL